MTSGFSPPWPRRSGSGRVTVLAHRGGVGPWRENTIEAFTAAIELGADGVELDVRRTADGVFVVHHDPVVAEHGAVHELRHDELPEWMPTLAASLRACAGSSVNVEIKNAPYDPGYDSSETIATEVLGAIAVAESAAQERAPAHVLISSFSASTIRAVAQAGAAVPFGLLVAPTGDHAAAIEEASNLGCRTLNVFHLRVSDEVVASVHEKGMALVVWTVNDPRQATRLVAAGVDVLITDEVASTLRAIHPDGGLVRGSDPRGQSGS